jgi:WhiB family redox-sensing transcriptional regulator
VPLTDSFKQRGKCNDPRYDPELWWPNGEIEEADKVEAAKEICAACPVQTECYLYATAERQFFGIWGGTTEEERREERRQARRKILVEVVDRQEAAA